ncbi:MAG: tRNA (adenosine(37)-N6)-threonylcarbamoyltransferase complex transferase subunit TsaD [Myxococcales bacterium]|nr:tRNA (adenosine(37)-N6)-threonylcarbamoyltransferase complex transferase subunit TsaD [Myxococcales bacterium]
MRVLGIESSCDECAAAVLDEAGRLLSSVVSSQIPIHAPYGGVVPELASRDHLRRILPTIREALSRAGCTLRDIDGLGVTRGPGLIGSLLVGVVAARTLSLVLERPVVGVNHLEAHLHAAFLERPDLGYPHLGLVVSGGHTSLFRVDGVGKLKLIGQTRDDAAGEAFDKAAKLLGLGYPGGVAIQSAAAGGDPQALCFPRPLPGKRPEFSFSGLKTSLAVHVKRHGVPAGQALADVAASFQEAVVDTLVKKTLAAARREKLSRVVVAGGVAANQRLRTVMQERGRSEELEVVFPSLSLCTDNAAMVAALARQYLLAGRDDRADLDADASLSWNAGSI